MRTQSYWQKKMNMLFYTENVSWGEKTNEKIRLLHIMDIALSQRFFLQV